MTTFKILEVLNTKACVSGKVRIILLEMNLSVYNIVIIRKYASNEIATILQREEFTKKLTDIIEKLGNQKEVLLDG